jgi:hypothetical protein
MTMVRKQFHIDPIQGAVLKRKARELGTSETEMMRRALDFALVEHQPAIQKNGVLKTVLESSLRFSKTHLLAEAYKFKRENFYSSNLI